VAGALKLPMELWEDVAQHFFFRERVHQHQRHNSVFPISISSFFFFFKFSYLMRTLASRAKLSL
jgi:hypothetical protein